VNGYGPLMRSLRHRRLPSHGVLATLERLVDDPVLVCDCVDADGLPAEPDHA